MEEDLEIRKGLVIPGSELWFTASRSGGPGGQHVNRTSSKVTLSWNIAGTSILSEYERKRVFDHLKNRINSDGVIQVHVSDERSQHRNREIARERLASLIRLAIIPEKKRVPTKPSAQSKQKRIDEKKQRASIKELRSKPKMDD